MSATYQPTSEQLTRARGVVPSTARRVQSTVMAVLRPGRWAPASWYTVADLAYCYLPDVPHAVIMRALLPLVAAGTLEAQDTPAGPQVRRVR